MKNTSREDTAVEESLVMVQHVNENLGALYLKVFGFKNASFGAQCWEVP